MKITKFKLLGADNKIKTLSVEGGIDNPFEFISNSRFSDYKVVSHEIIELGALYTQEEIINNK